MILDEVYTVIQSRQKTPVEGSYVCSLFAKGKDTLLKKIGEEATEVVIASKGGDRDQTIKEITDLWFHCLVLMSEEGISPGDIYQEFGSRFNTRRQ
ncbi:MAG: phosphoribosyl-ATP diphosphatase [Thermodesulfovibrio sp.]|nr:phosphoribosyl-ATP diphosphatase [Thermodesulfovibrio sp.]